MESEADDTEDEDRGVIAIDQIDSRKNPRAEQLSTHQLVRILRAAERYVIPYRRVPGPESLFIEPAANAATLKCIAGRPGDSFVGVAICNAKSLSQSSSAYSTFCSQHKNIPSLMAD